MYPVFKLRNVAFTNSNLLPIGTDVPFGAYAAYRPGISAAMDIAFQDRNALKVGNPSNTDQYRIFDDDNYYRTPFNELDSFTAYCVRKGPDLDQGGGIMGGKRLGVYVSTSNVHAYGTDMADAAFDDTLGVSFPAIPIGVPTLASAVFYAITIDTVNDVARIDVPGARADGDFSNSFEIPMNGSLIGRTLEAEPCVDIGRPAQNGQISHLYEFAIFDTAKSVTEIQTMHAEVLASWLEVGSGVEII